MKQSVLAVKDLAVMAGYGISMDPERYGNSLLQELDSGLDTFLSKIPVEFREEYEKRYIQKYSEWMRALSRCFSVMVTGGGNFNNRRHEKMNNYEHAARERFETWREKVVKRLNREQRLTGWAEVERLQNKLDKLTEMQETMKAVNKVARSKKLTEKERIDEIVALGLKEETAKTCLHPEYSWEKPGFPAYMLTNNLARIKATQELIDRYTAMASSEDKEIVINGGKIEVCNSDERIRIYFDEIPNEEMRTRLKGAAFKWSPRNQAWQRQLTPNAVRATNQLFQVNINL